MHITILKPGGTPVPPQFYGGTQRTLYWLGKAFIELGHQVTLIAHPKSHIPGAELIPAESTDTNAALRLVPDSTDILHLSDAGIVEAGKPFLITVNGNGHGPRRFHPNSLFVSAKHAANHGSKYFVHPGIEPSEYAFSEKREDYAVFLAKAQWKVKNLAGAVRVARQAGVELRVLGSRSWPLELQRKLPPWLTRGVRYYGNVEEKEKVEILSRARCLILPVRWHEPFGLAFTEAMVSGAYVCGTPYGSQPEIVTPEVGALSKNVDALADAARNPRRFKPSECRDRVLKGGFTHMDMARKYLTYYEKILTTGSLLDPGESPAATLPDFDPKKLLPWQGGVGANQ
ncbi:MAG TPA: glycosyltransferase [Candidatus Angelobacter sp.]|nr:glycosyltransferase [Candidatus Angelobacter sp.]